VKLLVDAGVDLQSDDAFKGLVWACEKGYLDIVNIFIKAGIDVNCYRNSDLVGFPIQAACIQNHYDIVKALLDAGANIHISDDKLINVCVSYTSNPKMLSLIVKAGAKLDKALEIACSLKKINYDYIKILLEAGADPWVPKIDYIMANRRIIGRGPHSSEDYQESVDKSIDLINQYRNKKEA